MLMMLVKILRVLNSEAEPLQISLALGFSMIAGFLPFFNFFNICVFFIVFLLRVNLSAFLLGTIFFSAIAYFLDPVFNRIGLAVLTAPSFEGLWTAMYNSTFWRLQRFNNSIVMGSIVTALLLFVPLVLLCNFIIRKYREHILGFVKKTPLYRMIAASSFYEMYRKVSGWRSSL